MAGGFESESLAPLLWNTHVVGSIAFTAVARVVLVAAKSPTEGNENRRVLARSKSNIGPDEGGFEYHIDQAEPIRGIQASYIAWGEPVAGTARELLAESETAAGDEAASARDADDSLREILKGVDRMDSRMAIDCLKANGFSDKQIRNARERIGAKVERSGFGAAMRSFWKLPQSCPIMPIDAQPEKGQEWARIGTTGGADSEEEAF